ncbi:glycosyltransferase family 9 protein [Pedobacter sp.]|uniref:glycosyltransferase family 9 protein n=1 Tax=Pedobacter sp. TaxID=1411316 RepID=UPI003D7FDC3D
MKEWIDCRNLLVIRADNMGDLLLSSPAIEALKQTFKCKITVLTSSKAQSVVRVLPVIDEVIVCDVPWVKHEHGDDPATFLQLLSQIKAASFDGCVVFTVYSQNPMPAILLAYLAEIPLRLAYCRENPYHLLSHWVPDKEPYHHIKHQVIRDLDLVATIGAIVKPQPLKLKVSAAASIHLAEKLFALGLSQVPQSYFILHPGVSEEKRRYPKKLWIALAQKLMHTYHKPLFITGAAADEKVSAEIAAGAGEGCISVAGQFELGEFATLIGEAIAVVSVNTSTVHLAAAMQTPVVVLHAETNPQHSPWMVPHQVLSFSVPEPLKSKNQVLHWVDEKLYKIHIPYPEAEEILEALNTIT